MRRRLRSGSHVTHCWRKQDSNPRSPLAKRGGLSSGSGSAFKAVFRLPRLAYAEGGQACTPPARAELGTRQPKSGTDGSNPVLPAGESGANRDREAGRRSRRRPSIWTGSASYAGEVANGQARAARRRAPSPPPSRIPRSAFEHCWPVNGRGRIRLLWRSVQPRHEAEHRPGAGGTRLPRADRCSPSRRVARPREIHRWPPGHAAIDRARSDAPHMPAPRSRKTSVHPSVDLRYRA